MTAATAPPASVTTVAVHRGNWLVGLVVVSVCLLPFLTLVGPGNTAPADLTIGLAVVVAALWASQGGLKIRFPYAWGVGGLVIGGSFAAWVSGAPAGVTLVLVQDLILLLWAGVLALGCHDVAIVRAATRAWCTTATVYSAVMVAAYLLGMDTLTGVTTENGVRASYTFGDPNLAGNYLMVSLFVMAACKRPRNVWLRGLGYTVVLLAIVFTGSNGAILTLATGGVVAVSLGRLRSKGAVSALLVLAGLGALAVLTVGYVRPLADSGAIRQGADHSIPLLRDSVGRSGNSTNERATLVDEGMRLWLRGDAAGYGPARTRATLQVNQEPYVKEAHNDYLATLVERGLIGAVGLLVLLITVAVYSGRLAIGRLPDRLAEIVPRAWWLAAIAPGMAVSGLFYEVLHFRHLWTWLGLVAALVLAMHDNHAKQASHATE